VTFIEDEFKNPIVVGKMPSKKLIIFNGY